jgi:hypothetical protein
MIQTFFDVVGSKPYPLLAKMGKSSKYHRDRGNTKREGKREMLTLFCLTEEQ